MAKAMAKVAGGVAAALVALVVTPDATAAAPPPVATVVLHTADFQHVPTTLLADAQRIATGVYADVGVRLIWTDGYARQAPADGAFHLDVVILTAELTERRRRPASAVGDASHMAKRAYIYYGRIISHAEGTNSEPRIALAAVLAHEVGHLLLPEYSHARSGIMRAKWNGRIGSLPGFLPAQAATIRRLLTIAN
jgi:hypothetical protein